VKDFKIVSPLSWKYLTTLNLEDDSMLAGQLLGRENGQAISV